MKLSEFAATKELAGLIRRDRFIERVLHVV